jgi:hypothetical protein
MKTIAADQIDRAHSEDPSDHVRATAEQNHRCKRCEHRYITHGAKGCAQARCKCRAFCK